MHNLFEGTAKYFLSLLLEKKVLTKESVNGIEARVLVIKSQKDGGRQPQKISLGFAGFKADQWRNWTVIYSEITLRGVIPAEHFELTYLQISKATGGSQSGSNLLCTLPSTFFGNKTE